MTYMTRAAKYFLSICVLSSILITVLYAFGMAAGEPSDLLYILFQTPKGWIFTSAVIILSLLYPRISFMKQLVAGSIAENREQIVEAFRTEGMVLTGEQGGELTFRAATIGRRILLRFDDTVTVRQTGTWIELDGTRKIVARVQYRLESYIHRNNE